MKINDRSNFRVQFKGAFSASDLPGGGGGFTAVAEVEAAPAEAVAG